jgi:hypothetical protein
MSVRPSPFMSARRIVESLKRTGTPGATRGTHEGTNVRDNAADRAPVHTAEPKLPSPFG